MKLLWLDCETTGLSLKTDGLIQLAGIIEIDRQVKEEFNFKMKPFKDKFVSKKALEVNKIKLEDLKGWPDPVDQYIKFDKLLSKYVDRFDRSDKFYMVGQNVSFDFGFLDQFYKDCNSKYLGSFIHYHKIDLIALTCLMKMAGKLNVDNLKLETIMKELKLGGQSHDALDDIKNTRKVFYTYLDWIS